MSEVLLKLLFKKNNEFIMGRMLKTTIRQTVGSLLSLMIIAGLGLGSCTYHTNDFDPVDVPDGISFEADIVPIFEANCNAAGCHNGSIAPDLRAQVAYTSLTKGGYVTDVTDVDNNILVQKIDVGGSMAIYATEENRAYIKKWIEEGALDN
jgi:uncharacterized protein YuzE